MKPVKMWAVVHKDFIVRNYWSEDPKEYVGQAQIYVKRGHIKFPEECAFKIVPVLVTEIKKSRKSRVSSKGLKGRGK